MSIHVHHVNNTNQTLVSMIEKEQNRTLFEGIAANCYIQQEDYVKNSWPHLKQAFVQNFAQQIVLGRPF